MSDHLFHISEDARIKVFEPRPAPAYEGTLRDKVVFAISNQMLHNYLLPRDCPRVTYYAGAQTTTTDQKKFFGSTDARYIVAVESTWLPVIQRAILYCYEFLPDTFHLLDGCAGYYISNTTVMPVSVKPIYNLIEAMLKRNVELRFMPSLDILAEDVKKSSLQFSLIRMRNAKKNDSIVDINDPYSWPIQSGLTILDLVKASKK